MAIEIIPATDAHCVQVALDMRESDRRELWLTAKIAPLPALRLSVEVSDIANATLIDGVPVQIYGRRRLSLLSDTAVIWMLATPGVERNPIRFFRRSVRMVGDLFGDGVTRLTNAVHSENTLSIQWLAWLGAEFAMDQPMGPYQQPFRVFELTKENMRCVGH